MIIAEQKPIAEIENMIAPYKTVALVGCKGCVTVCHAGGAKEVGLLAAALKLARGVKDSPIVIVEITIERGCEPEFADELSARFDAIEKKGPRAEQEFRALAMVAIVLLDELWDARTQGDEVRGSARAFAQRMIERIDAVLGGASPR